MLSRQSQVSAKLGQLVSQIEPALVADVVAWPCFEVPKDVAIKDITCKSKDELQQALFEAHLLSSLNSNMGPKRRGRRRPSAEDEEEAAEDSESLKIPLYLAHQVDQSAASEWHVRVAMTCVPG